MKKMFLIGIIALALLSIGIFVINDKFVQGAVISTPGQEISIGVINQDPDPAVAGNTFDIRLSVENSGSLPTGNMILEIVPTYPFEEVSGESLIQNIGSLTAFQVGSDNQIVKYRMKVNKDATQDTYDLLVRYHFEGQDTNIITKHLLVNVRASQSVEIIHIDKTVLVPGRQSSLKFVINNVGSSPLRDLTFSWSNNAQVILPVGSDNTKYISSLDVGANAEVEYQVIADTTVDAGLYPLNLVLKYGSASTNITTINTVAGVYVGGGTDFDVAFSDTSSGATSFTIANIGSNPATSVSVSIPEQRGWKTTGSNSIIIGNLNKGDYTVASFKLQSQASNLLNRTGGRNSTYSNTPGSNLPVANSADSSVTPISADSLIMQIAYTDTMGIRTLVNKTIKIGMQNILNSSTQINGAYGTRGTTSKSSGLSSYTLYIVGALVLIVGIVIYRRYKKQKLLSPNSDIKDLFKSKKK